MTPILPFGDTTDAIVALSAYAVAGADRDRAAQPVDRPIIHLLCPRKSATVVETMLVGEHNRGDDVTAE